MASNKIRIDNLARDTERELRQQAEDEFKSIAFEFYSRVVQGTPVDTGRAKGNWGLVDSVPGASADNPVVSIDKGGLNVIFLYNNLPYIISLEMGYSKKAPAGMIRVAAAELGLTVTGSLEG